MWLPRTAGSHPLLCTLSYCMMLFLSGSCINLIGPAGPTLARNLGSGITLVGTLFTAEGFGCLLGNSLLSVVLRRWSGHSVIVAVFGALFVVVGLVPTCSSTGQVVGLFFLIGAGFGLASSAANTLVAWAQPGRNVGPWVNLVNASYGLGASTSPLLFVYVERRMGNGLAAFSVLGMLVLVPILCVLVLQSPLPPPPTKEADECAEHELGDESRPLRAVGTARGARSTIAGIDLGSRAAYVRVTVVLPLMLMLTLSIGALLSFSGWIYSFAIERAGMRRREAAFLTSLFWSSFTAGRVCTIPISAYVSPATILIFTLAVEVCSMAMFIYDPTSNSVCWFGTVGAGIGVCAIYSNTISLLSSYDLLTPATVSVMGMACATGHMTVPSLVGHVIQRTSWGYDALLYIDELFYTVALVLLALVASHLSRHFRPALTAPKDASARAVAEGEPLATFGSVGMQPQSPKHRGDADTADIRGVTELELQPV